MNSAGAVRTITLSPNLSTILDDDWVEIWFRHGTNADEVIPEPLQIRSAILKDLGSTTGSNENLNNPNEWIGVEIGRMAGNNLNYFAQGTLYIGRDQNNLRLAMALNNQGTSPSIVTITHVPRGGPAGIAGPSGAGGTAGTDGMDGATGPAGVAGQTGGTGRSWGHWRDRCCWRGRRRWLRSDHVLGADGRDGRPHLWIRGGSKSR